MLTFKRLLNSESCRVVNSHYSVLAADGVPTDLRPLSDGYLEKKSVRVRLTGCHSHWQSRFPDAGHPQK